MKIAEQYETELFVGTNGHIVIKQSNPVECDYQTVLITAANAERFIEMLKSLVEDAKQAQGEYEQGVGE